eukprot:145541-Rhodomonas_salina.1
MHNRTFPVQTVRTPALLAFDFAHVCGMRGTVRAHAPMKFQPYETEHVGLRNRYGMRVTDIGYGGTRWGTSTATLPPPP